MWGIGVDQLAVARVRPMAEARWQPFLGLFTDGERRAADSRSDAAHAYAQIFAAKEAVYKALGLDDDATWPEIEIVAQPGHAPRVRLHGQTAAQAAARGCAGIEVSATEEAGVVTCVALAHP